MEIGSSSNVIVENIYKPDCPKSLSKLEKVAKNSLANDKHEEPGQGKGRKRRHSFLDLVECPICREFPRSGPIYNCSNGHVVCVNCLGKTNKKICAVCRDPNTKCRNLVAEHLLTETLKDTKISCNFTFSGCHFVDLLPKVTQHEKTCIFKTVRCPGAHRQACSWTGPMTLLVKHLCISKCALIIKLSEDNSKTFSSVIGNFNEKEMSIFERPIKTFWKPVLLISQQYLRLFPYLTIHRSADGIWTLCIRTFNYYKKNIGYGFKLTVKKPSSGNEENEKSSKFDCPSWSYIGDFIPHDMSENEVMESGNHLQITDDQVKRLCVDRTLFEYNVEFFEK